ncbi:acyltransferase family protein [Mycolicibacterium confluentis]|uniref:Uncharacterized protein n=1 Tax=Mycolicibacterium confluentis TaxID=28047 RepID=A0A7I7Y0M4_9MYCO|nr:acyltransferase [Mycolicibacterium confluentis]MCV7319874.1 acyltransferase [Mycolicibacterium confluentis]ORV34442.1 hypothetical protein AWB99_02160 [Mycolicibacterium confluentis]BBZ34904.1 hypothetical protein MCNF_35090 [Mycolicibacterium confluentis]
MLKNQKDASIETLRGLACILLVAFHVIGENRHGGLHVPDDSTFRWYADSFAYLRMPLFTFISGYVYALRPLTVLGNWPRFLRGKARRLLLPMFVIGTLLAVLQTYAPGVNEPFRTPWYLWHIVPVSPFWFIWAIFWVFFLVTLIDTVADPRRRTMLLVGAALTMALANVLVPATQWDIMGLRSALYLGPFFIAGLLASRFAWREAPLALRASVVVALVPLLAITQLGVLGVIPFLPPRASLIATLTGIVGCLALLLLRWSWKPLAFIGAYSFTIYLFHVPSAVGTRVLLKHAGIDDLRLLFIAGTLVGIAVPIVIEIQAKRNRWTSLFLLGQRKRSPAVQKQ